MVRKGKKHRPRQCGKRCYATEQDAENALQHLARTLTDLNVKRSVRSYQCPSCGKWHLTSNPIPSIRRP